MHRTIANGPVLRTTLFLFVMLTASAVQAQSHYRPGYTRHNLAEAKSVTVSSTLSGTAASSAVDADATSIWEADLSETNSWLQVDLGQVYTIDKARLDTWIWGTGLEIQVSIDNSNWSTVYSTSTATRCTETTFTAVAGRYVKLNFSRRIPSEDTYSVREIQIFQQGVPFDIPEFGFGFAAGLPASSSSDVGRIPSTTIDMIRCNIERRQLFRHVLA